jgi:predicted acylesterase/phospholipase RssA
MLQELVGNQGLDFQVIRGVSVGALNAAFLAQAPTQGDSLAELRRKVAQLHTLWVSEIKGNHSIYAERGGLVGIVVGADSLYSVEPLRRLIRTHINLQDLRNSGRDFRVGTVSLVSGHYQEWGPPEPDFLDKLLASASIPVVFPYIDLEAANDVLVDGGARNITPLSMAFDATPDQIYVLLTSRVIRTDTDLPESSVQEHDYDRWNDNVLGTKVSGFDVLTRTLNIVTDEIYLDDIRGALDWNEVVGSIAAVMQAAGGTQLSADLNQAIAKLGQTMERVQKKYVPLFVIAPQEWYGQENKETEFSPELIKRAIDHGRDVAANPRHPFVPAVLLGMGRLDELDPDPEVQPPRAQLRQARDAVGAEREAVVDPQHLREAEPAEDPPEDRPDVLHPLPGDDPAAEHVAAIEIADGQRVAPLAVLGPEPALEIRGPDRVGPGRGGTRRPVGLAHRPAPSGLPGQAVALEQPPEGARGRNGGDPVLRSQERPELLGAPARMPVPLPKHELHHLGGQARRTAVRPATPLPDAREPVRLVPGQPFVARLPTEPELVTQLGKPHGFPCRLQPESDPLFHRCHLLPGHAHLLAGLA